jgi:zinc protease
MRIKSNKSPIKAFLTQLRLGMAFAFFMSGLLCSCPLPHRDAALVQQLSGQPGWPQDHSDIAPDPGTRFGRLDNGLRFVIKENHTPRDRVSMHLLVQAGSLYEKPDEQGIAHFIEHMLFNGSAHFDPGEMVKFFQRIGMQFGPDANAHTGFTQTVFDIVLPMGDEKSLSEGLLVMRDYADGALLLPEEVISEKKVILAEMRSRDSAQFRTFKAALQFELPGLLIGHRFPIGEAEVIANMDHLMIRQFYQTWYRPERMILVVVGDLKPDGIIPLIRKRFGDFEAHGPSQSPPAIGAMKHQGVEAFYHHEEETGMTRVAVETVAQKPEPSDSTAYRRWEMTMQLAGAMIQHRLDVVTQSTNTVLTAARTDSGYYLRQIKYTQIEADCKPEAWRDALGEIERALRKALAFGFTPEEVQRAKKDYKAKMLKSVQEERTRDSNALAREILSDLDDQRVFQSPRQQLQMLAPYLEAITPAQIHQVLSQAWNGNHRLILVTGNADLSSGTLTPAEQIKDAFSVSCHAAVQPDKEKRPAHFPYLPQPLSSGTIVQRRYLKDLGIEQVTFGNGFSLNLKPTRFKENQVMAALSLGSGEASEPIDLPGLSKMTQAVITESGFGALDRIELEEALSGRLADIKFAVQEDMLLVKGEADSSELPLLFQLLHTFIKDPGYSQDARRLVLKRLEQEYESMPHSVDGMMQLKVQRFLAGGDSRFGAPAFAQLQQRSNQQIKAWLEGQMDLKTMELAIVGDFDSEKVVELAARYFGSLESFSGKVVPSMADRQRGPEFPRGQTLKLTVDSDIPKALVVVAFPTEDFWDIRRTRRLNVVAELFSERLRESIREKLGAAYSPYAFNHSYRAYKGYGMIQIHVLADPRQTDAIVEEIRHIAGELTVEKADPDEFKRVIDPTLTSIKDLRQTNAYWLNNVLAGVGRHPQQLEWSRTIKKDYASITSKEVAALARRYLVWDSAAVIVLTPEKNNPANPITPTNLPRKKK